MIIKNVKVYTPEKDFQNGIIEIRDGVFVKVEKTADEDYESCNTLEEEVIDGGGCYAVPGLIDIHFHGCMGHDFCDGTKEAISEIAKYEASVGVTAIAPATMTLPIAELENILEIAADYRKDMESKPSAQKADLVGINMEGPFISPVKKGAQNASYIVHCNTEIALRFLDVSDGLVKIIGLAPEESVEATEYVKQMQGKVHVSLAHTNADYEIAKAALEAGADHAVHLYNAMPSFNHREPGVVGAVANCPHATAELICDGVHIHPAVVRATFQMMGEDRMILISDSMRATGMPDGRYSLGGLDVDVQGNRATLVSDGALAGSATNLMDCMRTAVKKMGISLETAVACATVNPAKKLGVYEKYGSIEPGKKANVVLLGEELELIAVVKDGVRIK